MPDSERKSLIKKAVGKGASTLSASHKHRPTDQFFKVISRERPIAIFLTALFMVVSPLVFRYAMYSSVTAGQPETKYYAVGNGTLALETEWGCTTCTETEGITLSAITIKVDNVTSPDVEGGFPSIALFASQDMVTW
jgi:hypothetical protein